MLAFVVLLFAKAAMSATILDFPSFTGIFGVLFPKAFPRYNISMYLITDIKFSVDRGFVESSVVNTDTKEFYLAANLASFAEAKEHCSQTGYDSLANIETENDFAAMKKLLDRVKLTKVWVGGTQVGNEWCEKHQPFNASCWIWGDNKNSIIASKSWHDNVQKHGRKQSSEDRVFYMVESKKLDFEANTRLNQFVCQRGIGQGLQVMSSSPAKQFYYSSNAATFNEAIQHCKNYGYSSLALIETERDVLEIKKILDGAMVSQLWVGGAPTTKKYQGGQEFRTFSYYCWVWGEDDENAVNFGLWHSQAFRKNHSAVDKTVFKPLSQKLNFEADTNLNQFICERSIK